MKNHRLWRLYALFDKVKRSVDFFQFLAVLFASFSAVILLPPFTYTHTYPLVLVIFFQSIIFFFCVLFSITSLSLVRDQKKILSDFLLKEGFVESSCEDPLGKVDSILKKVRNDYLNLIEQNLKKEGVDYTWDIDCPGLRLEIKNTSDIPGGKAKIACDLIRKAFNFANDNFGGLKMPFTFDHRPRKLDLLGKIVEIHIDFDSFDHWEV